MNKKLAATLLLPLFLAACGGGGGDDDNDPPAAPPPETPATPETPPPVDAVTQASLDTATRLGLAPIAGNAGKVRVYDVVADIGDTWRLTLDMETGAYTLKVLHTVYGLTDTSGTFTQSTNGSFITLTGASGAFTLLIDERTRTIAGAMAVGGKSATVSGTSYAVPTDVAVLAGTYTMLIAAHNIPTAPEPGDDPYPVMYQVLPGAVQLRADGTAVICIQGTGVTPEGLCSVPNVEGEEPDNAPGLPAKLALNATDGEYHVSSQGNEEVEANFDLGILRVQASDFGPMLTLDLSAENGIGAAGVTYLAPQRPLAGNEVDGAWQCSMGGKSTGTVAINGTALQQTDATGAQQTSTLNYNEISNPPESLPINTLVSVVTTFPADPDDDDQADAAPPQARLTGVILPMSSSVMLYTQVNDSTSVSLCHRNGN